MNEELRLKVQAYLDGELPASEAREVAELVVRDAGVRSLHAELKNTRAALKEFEAEIKLPESREFYWSKIQREIKRVEEPESVEEPVWFAVWLRRYLAPAGALAALVIAATLAWQQLSPGFSLETETAFADSDAFTYRDYSKGMTLVWLSYPAENEFTELVPANIFE
jgi:anti-sigma factor RsiW